MGQAPSDAYRNSQSELNGTARAQALSGAIGAVGADPSAVSINPSGVALFSRNNLSASFELGKGMAKSEWINGKDAFNTNDKWNIGSLNNFNITRTIISRSVYSPLNLNFGFTINKDYDYRREYGLITSNPKFGLTDYMAFEASRIGAPWKTKQITPVIDIARDARFIEAFTNDAANVPGGQERRYRSQFSGIDRDGSFVTFTPLASNLNVQESGYRYSYEFNLGAGYSDIVYFGAGFIIGSQYSSRVATYHEDFFDNFNNQTYESNLNYETGLRTKGEIIGMNLGVLVALSDYGRIGISYLTPQYANYREVYWASANGHNAAFQGKENVSAKTDDLESSYSALIPGRLNVSALAFLGRFGFLSYDYQYRNLGSAKLYYPEKMEELSESAFIKEDLGREHTHRVGLEVRPIDRLSIRAGYSYTGNPMKAEQLRAEPEQGLTYSYVPSGYITDFVLPRSYQTATAGLGFQLTHNMAIDMAYVYGWRKEQVYPFSGSRGELIVDEEGYIDENGKPQHRDIYDNVHMEVKGGTLETSKHKFVATLSLRF